MITRTLAQVAEMVNGKVYGCNSPQTMMISGVAIDSRAAGPGTLFVPLAGERTNGHRFVEQAIESGAAATLWQRNESGAPLQLPYIEVEDTREALQQLAKAYRHQLDVKVVAITGSMGKTTTKDMVAALLATTYRVHKTAGNLNTDIGLPLTLLSMPADTEVVVVEMGMRGREEIALLSRLAEPEIAVITCIGESHLERLGSKQEIASAKMEIASGLASNGVLIYPTDEPLLEDLTPGREQVFFERMGFHMPEGVQRILVSDHDSSTEASFTAQEIESQGRQISFKWMQVPTHVFTLPMPGRHNVTNALCALAVASHLNVDPSKLPTAFANLEISRMRLEYLAGDNGVTVLNDAYNASPSSMQAALQSLDDLQGYKRKIVVLADMLELGEQAEAYHEQIGHTLQPQAVDIVFTYGRLAAKIAEAAQPRFAPSTVQAYVDKEPLIAALVQTVVSGDLILLKGSRGMQLEELLQHLV